MHKRKKQTMKAIKFHREGRITKRLRPITLRSKFVRERNLSSATARTYSSASFSDSAAALVASVSGKVPT